MTTIPAADQAQIPSIWLLLVGIWSHLSRRRRVQLGLLLSVMIISGGAELLSLGALLPFLTILTNPQRLWQQPLVQQLASTVGYTEPSQLLFPATLGFVVTTVLAALARLANLWMNGLLAGAIGSDLSCEAYRRTLYQPYSVHIQRNTSTVIARSTIEINLTVVALNALLQLVTSSIVASGLLVGLLFIDAKVALVAVVLFGGLYCGLASTTRRELNTNGRKSAEYSIRQVKALQEGLGAIRDVLLDGSQAFYLEIYRQADHPQRRLQAKNVFISSSPRYALEALGMVSIAVLGLMLVLQRGSGASVIPLLGAIALGAQRLLPALQQIYGAWASLAGYKAALSGVLGMLNQPLPRTANKTAGFVLCSGLRLESVSFRYEQDLPNVVDKLSLDIAIGERIGLIGSTGSGKSTTVDLLMGLLEPTAGRVLVDGKDLHDLSCPGRLQSWRASIAHVPQSIYLADSSIAENIAFGVPSNQIDLDRVRSAAAHAQISAFIEASDNGYGSFVGERGIRLSGGQRQRIGIARALYKNAKVLVFDEATSALDGATEQSVMDAIDALNKNLMIIIIAHRLTTVERCDRVIRLEHGRVVAQGSPAKMILDEFPCELS